MTTFIIKSSVVLPIYERSDPTASAMNPTRTQTNLPIGRLIVLSLTMLCCSTRPVGTGHSEATERRLVIPMASVEAAVRDWRDMGSQTEGGVAGRVLRVTHLEPNGPGSLRDALEAEGPRLVSNAELRIQNEELNGARHDRHSSF